MGRWLQNQVEEHRLQNHEWGWGIGPIIILRGTGSINEVVWMGGRRLLYQLKPQYTYFQVAESYATYEAADEGLDAARSALLAAIRERYGQEQAWGDKVRRASTW